MLTKNASLSSTQRYSSMSSKKTYAFFKDTRYHDSAMATHDQRTIEALSVMNLGALRGEKLDDVDG